MATTKTIKLTGSRDSRPDDRIRFGINGRIFNQRVGSTMEAEPEVIDFLNDNGISFEEVSGGAGSKEGSAAPAPEDTPPHMLPRSVDDRGDGGNSGDATAAGFLGGGGGGQAAEKQNRSIAEEAKVSDLRVAAERQASPAPVLAPSPAALAGEGEGGAPKAHPPKSEAPKREAAKPAAKSDKSK